jgi:hypothetical protein
VAARQSAEFVDCVKYMLAFLFETSQEVDPNAEIPEGLGCREISQLGLIVQNIRDVSVLVLAEVVGGQYRLLDSNAHSRPCAELVSHF